MSLSYSQKRFDKNHDGKLSWSEWNAWAVDDWFIRYDYEIWLERKRLLEQEQRRRAEEQRRRAEEQHRYVEQLLNKTLNLKEALLCIGIHNEIIAVEMRRQACAREEVDAVITAFHRALDEGEALRAAVRWEMECDYYHIPLYACLEQAQTVLTELIPKQAEALREELRRAFLYQLTCGAKRNAVQPDYFRAAELRAFLDSLSIDASCIQKAFQDHCALFEAEGELTEGRCGTFWSSFIQAAPPELSDEMSRPAQQLCCVLGYAYAFCLRGYAEKTAAEQKAGMLSLALRIHWKRYAERHPQTHRVIARLQSASVHDFDRCCRDFLTAYYPQLVDDILQYSGQDAWLQWLRSILKTEPAQAVEIWRSLLTAGESCLHEPSLAGRLLPDGLIERSWLRTGDREHLQPFLDALEEDAHFAQQVFGSASVNRLQADLLCACNHLDRIPLGECLLDMLRHNALPEQEWQMPLEHYERKLRRGLTEFHQKNK